MPVELVLDVRAEVVAFVSFCNYCNRTALMVASCLQGEDDLFERVAVNHNCMPSKSLEPANVLLQVLLKHREVTLANAVHINYCNEVVQAVV